MQLWPATKNKISAEGVGTRELSLSLSLSLRPSDAFLLMLQSAEEMLAETGDDAIDASSFVVRMIDSLPEDVFEENISDPEDLLAFQSHCEYFIAHLLPPCALARG